MRDDANSPYAADVLRQADEFIKRRRAQLDSAVIDSARTDNGNDAAIDDDIPLLTDIVPTTVSGDPVLREPPPLPPLSLSSLNADIARALDAWLDEHLPQVIAHAMDGITDQLIQHIHQNAERDLLPRLNRALLGTPTDADDRSRD